MKKITLGCRLTALSLAIITLVSLLSGTALADRSGVYFTSSKSATSGNYSVADSPATCNSITCGESLYLVAAGSKEYYFSKIVFYVKTPNSSSYQCVHTDSVTGYIRYSNYQYTFDQIGVYGIRVELYNKYSNDYYYGERTVQVTGAAVAEGTFYIVPAVDTTKTLDVYGASANNCADLIIYDNNGWANQQFKLTKNGDYYVITAVHSGKAVDVENGSCASGTNIQQYQVNGTAAQNWKFISVGDGSYYIRSQLGTYMDVYYGYTSAGTTVWAHQGNSSAAQRWYLVPAGSTVVTALASAKSEYPAGTQWFGTFDGSSQCSGYARMIFYKIHGYEYYINNPGGIVKKITDKNYIYNGLKVGDLIRYKNNGHSVIVTGIDGNTVYVTDCNSDWKCTIRWDAALTRERLATGFTYAYTIG